MLKQCKCGKPLMILNHYITGNPAPIEATTTDNGNILLESGNKYRVIKKGETTPEGAPRYVNHYANCPHASSWREETAKKKETK
jgi:hypothetical protein